VFKNQGQVNDFTRARLTKSNKIYQNNTAFSLAAGLIFSKGYGIIFFWKTGGDELGE
jgi:hypothetical protein